MKERVVYGMLTVSVVCWSIEYLYKMLRKRRARKMWLAYFENPIRQYPKETLAQAKTVEDYSKAYEEKSIQNPSDPQILKNLAYALSSRVYMMPKFSKTFDFKLPNQSWRRP